MKNIETLLKEIGLEIPAEHAETFRKAFHENYKTINDYGKLETDRNAWKEKAETAETTLKGFEGVDLETMQSDLKAWKQKAEDAEKDYTQKLYERDFNDALKTEIEKYHFSSEAAKNAIVAEISGAGLKLKDGKILGLNDLINSIKEKDPAAIVDAEAEKHKAQFTAQHQNNGGGGMTKEQILAIKDRAERRAAIAANMKLFEGEK